MRRMFREGQHLPSERIEGLYVRCPTPSRIDLKLSLLACLMEEAERKGPIAGHVDALGEQEPTRGLPIDAEGCGRDIWPQLSEQLHGRLGLGIEHVTRVTSGRADQFQEQQRRVGLASLDDDAQYTVSLIPVLGHVQDVR